MESLGFEPSCIDASGDMVAIGNKLGKDCFIYNTTGGSIGNKRELGIDDPITAVAFRFWLPFYFTCTDKTTF